MNREYYDHGNHSRLMPFFWKCSGGDRTLLERATYSDQVKYTCLGGIIVATGLMAGLSSGYAFYTIFSPKTANVLDRTKTLVENANYVPTDIPTLLLSILFGLLWGLMIFNLDRFIVTSTGKGDGTEKITKDELVGAIPRIIMGIIIAITISKPIEIRMFKTEVDLAVAEQQEKEKQVGIEQAQVNYNKKMADTKAKLGKIQTDIDAKEAQIAELRNQIAREITGANQNGAAYGPRAKELERQADILTQQENQLKATPEYQSALADAARFRQEYNNDVTQAQQKATTYDGLLLRIQKVQELAPVISIFVTLLFMAIELTPIFFKLMLIKTPYDFLAENRDELLLAEHGIEVRYDFYKDKKGLEKHLVINHEADRLSYEKIKLSEIQKELTDYAVDIYKNQEKEKINAHPEDYIKPVHQKDKDA